MHEFFFPKNYQDSRERFRSWKKKIDILWPQVRLMSYSVGETSDDLTIDVLEAPANKKNKHLFLLTTGEHGIEGYAGSAMLEFFLHNFLSRLHPETTALCLVHAINPWGMKNKERNNPNNVDLNRNFIYDWKDLHSYKSNYSAFARFLSPQKTIHCLFPEYLLFFKNILGILLRGQKDSFKETLLAGQYEYPNGVYYGGKEYQKETLVMMELFRHCFSISQNIVHIDIHTGYGPRHQMSIVHSPLSKISSSEYARETGYPRILCAINTEFYKMQGDMIDFLYRLQNKEFPDRNLYSACFEFGCFGDSILSEAKSLFALIFNNRMRHFGSTPNTATQIHHLWQEAYFPKEEAWRKKALNDFEFACACVLKKYGIC